MKNNIITASLLSCLFYKAEPYKSQYAQERTPELREVTHINAQPAAIIEEEPDVFETPPYDPEEDFSVQCLQFMRQIIDNCQIDESDADPNDSKLVKALNGDMIQFDRIARYVDRDDDGGIVFVNGKYRRALKLPYIALIISS